jgi:hypothetical protein
MRPGTKKSQQRDARYSRLAQKAKDRAVGRARGWGGSVAAAEGEERRERLLTKAKRRRLAELLNDRGDREEAVESLWRKRPELALAVETLLVSTQRRVRRSCSKDARRDEASAVVEALRSYGVALPPAEDTADKGRACEALGRVVAPEDPFSVIDYQTIETYPLLRWDWLHEAQRRLGDWQRLHPLCDVEGLLRVGQPLGSGTYGKVYLATFYDDPFGYPVAYKVAIQDVEEQSARFERTINEAVGAVVGARLCPNFTLLYAQCEVSVGEGLLRSNTITEFADGTLSQLLAGQPDRAVSVSAAMQCLVAIVAMSYLDISHNDLYASNVFYNRIDPDTWLVYNVLGRALSVPTFGVLFKVSDFGIATSPHLLGEPHESTISEIRGRKPLVPVPSLPKLARNLPHVVFIDMPTFGRDVFAVLKSILVPIVVGGENGDAETRWLLMAIERTLAAVSDRGSALERPEGVRALIASIFDDASTEALLVSPDFALPDRGRATVMEFDVDAVAHRAVDVLPPTIRRA